MNNEEQTIQVVEAPKAEQQEVTPVYIKILCWAFVFLIASNPLYSLVGPLFLISSIKEDYKEGYVICYSSMAISAILLLIQIISAF